MLNQRRDIFPLQLAAVERVAQEHHETPFAQQRLHGLDHFAVIPDAHVGHQYADDRRPVRL
jgi:hypothetical protein